MRNAYTLPLRSWLASALRRQAEATSCWEPERRSQLLERAAGIAKKAIRVARSHQNDLPHALREAGLISLMQGSVRKARQYLDESLDVAKRQAARFEHAQTLLARGRAGVALGWAGAADDLTAARQALMEMGADWALDEPVAERTVAEPEPVTLSLADRFDTVLDAGRSIASALAPDAIFAAVRDAAVKLLRGEQCVVLRVHPERDAEATPVSGEMAGVFCPTMVHRALSASRAVTYSEGASDEASETLLLSGIRSALCAPILVRGRAEACLFVTHRGVSGLFAEDEQRLADFIAAIAGAALENADGFSQLQQLTATLEQRVQDRTAALEASNIELQQFAYIASHDLQTPLRGIAGFSQFLQQEYQGRLDETADGYLVRIIEGTKRMQTLIKDLLSYSRIDSRSRPFEPTNLNEVVEDAVTILDSSIQDSGGTVTRDELPTVAADRSQLVQLLQNLIGNALKYHGDQTPRVHVSAENGGHEWTISVRDNGIGIEDKHHERIFEIFRRLHTQTEYPGTGIGLAVCRRIVQRHNGRIWVESEPGRGSTFRFTVPVR